MNNTKTSNQPRNWQEVAEGWRLLYEECKELLAEANRLNQDMIDHNNKTTETR
jgi:hypothetical protein